MKNNIMYKNVEIGKNVSVGDFVILGKPPSGRKNGELKLVIGDNAIIRSHTIIYAGNKIGNNFQTGHNVMIRECNIIGNNVSIGTGSCLEHHIKIGDYVRIHSQVFIPEYSIIEKNAWIGPNVVFTNAQYPKSKEVKNNLRGPYIESGAKIGANATLLPGILVGSNALIGAGSVVVYNVNKNDVVVGNPAKVIKQIKDINDYEECY